MPSTSTSSPPAAMLPPPRFPPTVPSKPLVVAPPLPLSHASFVEQPTAPPLSTVASSRPISSPPSLPDMIASSDSESVHSASPTTHPHLFRAPLLFQPHAFTEASRSVCLPLSVLLLLRLFPVASLVGHLVFFSLHADFNFTEYLTWNYFALTLALLLALTCSLLDVIHDHPDQQDNESQEFPTLAEHNKADDVERQSRIATPSSQPKWLLFLTRLTVPAYQLAVSATIFGAVVFWAAVYPNATIPLTYALLAQAVAAPAIAIVDFFLSFHMNFRLIYIFLYILYNAAYVAVAYTLTERAYIFVFLRRDASRSAFAAKAAGLAAACLFTAVLLYFITALRSLRSTRSLPDAISARSKSKRILEDRPESASRSAASSHSHHSDLSQLGLRRIPSNSFYDSAEFVHVENEDQIDQSTSLSARDRASVPIDLGGGSSGRSSWFRASSARLTATLSGGSAGEARPGFARTSSSSSVWEDMDQPAPQKEDEVFSMPACYNATKQHELARMSQVPRIDSAKQLPRLVSRQASGRFSRTSSTSSARLGPAPHLPSSAITASMFVRNGSAHYSTDRTNREGGGAETR
ncbi:unnamed protein product [Agarophyton chilense]